MAVRAAEAGHRVVGSDVDSHRVQRLAAGQSCLRDVASSRLRAVLASGAYSATTDAAALAGFDIAVITLPTPLRDGVPDLTYIESCARTPGEHLRHGATVVLKSTSYRHHRGAAAADSGRGLRPQGGADFRVADHPAACLASASAAEICATAPRPPGSWFHQLDRLSTVHPGDESLERAGGVRRPSGCPSSETRCRR
ncbi:hypothetical protein ACGFY8_36995 [Streptomyces sp. NPDC048232]|uniref:hypothetical protein n=1 Tax=Streptomyces sp. NPDC048232 TaxID=3365520 RepID=UPI00370FF7A5